MNKEYILRSVAPHELKYFRHMFDDLRSSPCIRVPEDAGSVFVYLYIQDHLLSFAQKEVPLPTTNQILRNALLGFAAMHDKKIIHTLSRQTTF
jgi:hypothetical protein